jgi:hypothetical protein
MEAKKDLVDEKALEEGLRSAKGLIQSFLQTLKAYRLYDADHPILVKFLDRLKKDFENYFKESDSFFLQVGQHQLFFRGKPVYESQDVKESLAFLFYKDGIREMRFFNGLEFREMVDFLEVVRKSDRVNRCEDDLVTLLWEKDFSHIAFTTVDEFLDAGATTVPATEQDLVRRLEYRGFDENAKPESPDERQGEEPKALLVENLKQALHLSPGQTLSQACRLEPEEWEEIQREILGEQQPGHLFVVIDNLIEILLHLGEDADAYENMISYFQRTFISFLEQNEVGRAAALLERLNDTIESMVLKDKQIFAIRRILETASTDRAIDFLGRAMKQNGEIHTEFILHYLRQVTTKAVEPLCELLGNLESGKWRKALCERLAELSQEDIQPIAKFLLTPNPVLLSHLLYVLGKTGHPDLMKVISPLAEHEDRKIREETLKVLSKMGTKGRDLFLKFLNDPVPEIRGKTSFLFAKAAGEEAAQPLLDIILSEDFVKRDYEEKTLFFRALGETRSGEAIPVLKKIAGKRKWFQRAKWNEMRQGARATLKILESGQEKSLQSRTVS